MGHHIKTIKIDNGNLMSKKQPYRFKQRMQSAKVISNPQSSYHTKQDFIKDNINALSYKQSNSKLQQYPIKALTRPSSTYQRN
jgi:hypothetical protein